VTVATRIGATGSVDAADLVELDGLSDAVGECIRRALATSRFEAPGDATRLNVPVKFVQQHDGKSPATRVRYQGIADTFGIAASQKVSAMS
jgi:hypothetical protein